jgi:rubrerythrin
MEFVHPFPGKNPGDKISKQELISALRLSLCAEEEATHLYDTIAEYTDDERVKKIMKDVADEEQVHIGEFQKLLDLIEEDEVEKVGEGEKEAEEKMGEKTAESITPADIAKLIEE